MCMCVFVGALGVVLDKGRRRILYMYFGVVAIVVLFDRLIKRRKNINISPSSGAPARSTIAKKILVTHRWEKIW